jgi:hypothetical protein
MEKTLNCVGYGLEYETAPPLRQANAPLAAIDPSLSHSAAHSVRCWMRSPPQPTDRDGLHFVLQLEDEGTPVKVGFAASRLVHARELSIIARLYNDDIIMSRCLGFHPGQQSSPSFHTRSVMWTELIQLGSCPFSSPPQIDRCRSRGLHRMQTRQRGYLTDRRLFVLIGD